MSRAEAENRAENGAGAAEPQPSLRTESLDALDGGHFDVFVIGGGINGAVSAAALADRGLKVAVVDRGDFAHLTSQESSNLVWGGFKYLQNYELHLVYKLCRSRNLMMRSYPTTMTEVGFLATLDRTAPFPSWLAGLGSAAYWAIGGFFTERPRYFRPKALKRREPLIDTSTADAGLEYADAYLLDNDARFVWSFVRTAIDLGAVAANYTSVDRLERTADGWTVEVTDTVGQRSLTATATALVNAAGPLVDAANEQIGAPTRHRIVYSKGIHLVVPRLNESERVLAFFDDTQRLFYVIPMAHRSVIGTTDTRTADHDEKVTDEERRFLLDQINDRLDLGQPLTIDDIIAERCGVRPLVVEADGGDQQDEDWTKLSRKHVIEWDADHAVVSIFGGKLTDCLNVGDEVVEAVADIGLTVQPEPGPWYGEPPVDDRQRFFDRAARLGLDRAPDVERAATVAHLLWRRHGEAAHQVLDAIEADPSAGQSVLADSDLLRAELALYRDREMIVTLEDFLRRRTKLGLIHRAGDLANDPGMAEVCQTLGLPTTPAMAGPAASD